VFRPNFWNLEPVSRDFGFDRGLPLDRYYIERFLAAEAAAIHGCVLEIEHDLYTRRFGGDHVTRSDVLYREAGLPGATIVADLADAPQIASDTFDCIILIHTLQYIFDAAAALRTCRRILKPGGALLIAVPFIGQYSPGDRERWGEYWRFSRMALARMLADAFGSDTVHVDAYGNALAATAFLQGIAADELAPFELDHYDPNYDLIITGTARKQS
jgi:SAM-dependent methyltransferase